MGEHSCKIGCGNRLIYAWNAKHSMLASLETWYFRLIKSRLMEPAEALEPVEPELQKEQKKEPDET